MAQKNEIKGMIALYNLQDWWFSTFSEAEREYMNEHYRPMGLPPNSLTQGEFQRGKHKITIQECL